MNFTVALANVPTNAQDIFFAEEMIKGLFDRAVSHHSFWIPFGQSWITFWAQLKISLHVIICNSCSQFHAMFSQVSTVVVSISPTTQALALQLRILEGCHRKTMQNQRNSWFIHPFCWTYKMPLSFDITSTWALSLLNLRQKFESCRRW